MTSGVLKITSRGSDCSGSIVDVLRDMFLSWLSARAFSWGRSCARALIYNHGSQFIDSHHAQEATLTI